MSNNVKVYILSIRLTGAVIIVSTLALSLCSPVRANTKIINVNAVGCTDVNFDRVKEIILMELAMVRHGSLPAFAVTFVCTPGAVEISAADPLTGKHLRRKVVMASLKIDGKERALALSASQLFIASWLELLVPSQRAAPVPPTEQTPAHAHAAQLAREAIAPAKQSTELSLLGGVNLRTFNPLFALGVVGLNLSGGIWKSLRLFGKLSGEFGKTSRSSGTVNAAVAAVGAGVAWRQKLTKYFSLQAGVAASEMFVKFSGKVNSAKFYAGEIAGVATDFSAHLCPVIILKNTSLLLTVKGGYVIQTWRAKVADDKDISFNSLWAGVSLGMGFH